jgi:hypothetical protein
MIEDLISGMVPKTPFDLIGFAPFAAEQRDPFPPFMRFLRVLLKQLSATTSRSLP